MTLIKTCRVTIRCDHNDVHYYYLMTCGQNNHMVHRLDKIQDGRHMLLRKHIIHVDIL